MIKKFLILKSLVFLIILFSNVKSQLIDQNHHETDGADQKFLSFMKNKLNDLFEENYKNKSQIPTDQFKNYIQNFHNTIKEKISEGHEEHEHHDHDHEHVHHDHDHSHDHSHQETPIVNIECLSKKLNEIFSFIKATDSNKPFVDKREYTAVQPLIVYQLESCLSSRFNKSLDHDHDHHHHHHGLFLNDFKKENWIFAFVSAFIITIIGIICYLIVPSITSEKFKYLFQFLVALAIGTLTGDSLLHLIPHAFSEHDHDHENSHEGHDHSAGVYKGLAAFIGIYVFFIVEKILMIRRSRKEKKHKKIEMGQDQGNINQYSKSVPTELNLEKKARDESFFMIHANKDLRYISQYLPNNPCTVDIEHHDCEHEVKHLHKHSEPISSAQSTQGSYFTNDTESKLIVAESNENCVCTPEVEFEQKKSFGHGHSHKHHVYKSSREKAHHDHHKKHEKELTDIKLIAWMVLMGDGLHNFADGLAIGASFASSLTLGFGTSIAVLCHELPHEIGDFAVLRRAGVSLKRALFFNGISGILCMFGVLVGLLIGEFTVLKNWSFLFIAGTFLYISLVDMIPELSADSEDDSILNFVVQSLGILVGVVILLVIALFEEQIIGIFKN
ncbi:unnamed protein product [Brachionus calyciflorus]|uniref:Uncharacterized protein n=1 Tax=Brachionus calyciflorus TaxID=104777 RepID=A0A814B1Q0_9BILA|nr:unnamed protein product [Brachionus calyciflorus]